MKKKTLLITGKNAERSLLEFIDKERIKNTKILALKKINVASFISPEILLEELKKENLNDIEKIIVPGNAKGDFSMIEKELGGIICKKGPACFSYLLDYLKGNKEKKGKVDVDKELEELKGKESFMNYKGFSYVVSEINCAPLLSSEELKKVALYYEKSGSDIIDIGMVAGGNDSKKVPDIIKVLKNVTNLPLSIDSLNENEILSAIDFGIDLVISLDFSNYEKVLPKIGDIPFVIIPRDRKGFVPRKACEKIALIEKLMKKVEGKKFIVDLILDPINLGFSESLKSFIDFRKNHPLVPMMMGLGNVTELIDADSVGINGLLSGIAAELNINLLLTTEGSNKTKGSVKEVSVGAKMMYLAKRKKIAPKDLGIFLLKLKEKHDKNYYEIKLTLDEKNLEAVEIEKNKEPTLEKNVYFRIIIEDEKINVVCYKKNKPVIRFTGSSGESLYKEILSKNIIKNLEHSSYLGAELMKAEIALKLGRNYIQDEDLF